MINFSSVTPNVLTFQSKTIDNLKKIANIFNSYFSSIGKKAQTKINYSDKNYNDYLTTKTPPFPLTITDKEEMKLIFLSLDIRKQDIF